MTYEFTIPDNPVGKQRPRFGNGRVYTPKETVQYENLVKLLYRGQMFEGQVTVTIMAYYKKPARCKDKYPLKKPDIDNVAKIILDGLNGVAYADDKQVVNLIVFKRWGEPRVEVTISKEEP